MSSIENLLSAGVDNHLFPGCALGLIDHGQVIFFSSGRQTYNATATLINEKTIYDLASITKSIPTSSLVLQLIEVGKINLEDDLEKYFPVTRDKAVGKISIRQLLTFSPQFPFALSKLKNSSAEEILETIINSTWTTPLEKNYPISNTNAILLTLLLQVVTTQPVDILAATNFFEPLGMNRTTFHPEPKMLPEITPTEIQDWRGGLVHGLVHDESAWKLSSKMVSGSAGLFSCVDDLIKFGQMILNKGVYHDRRFFKPKTIEMVSAQGLGWECKRSWMGARVSDRAFGKTGFTGCFVLFDPVQDKGLVFLSNCVYPHRPVSRQNFNVFRSQICDLIMGD